MRPAAWPAVRSATAGSPSLGIRCRSPGRLGRLERHRTPAASFRRDNQTKIDAIGLFTGQVGYAWNTVLWYVKGGAAVTHDRYRSYHAPLPPGTVFNTPARPAGAAPSAPASRLVSRRAGRSQPNTIICSWAIAHRLPGHRSRCRAPTTSPGRRHGHRAGQLPLGRPGDREILSFAYSLRN